MGHSDRTQLPNFYLPLFRRQVLKCSFCTSTSPWTYSGPLRTVQQCCHVPAHGDGSRVAVCFLHWSNSSGLILFLNIYIYIYIYIYIGCHRRNGPDFGRVFLMLKYTDITQTTYIQSWTVTEIMAREVWNFDSCYTLIDYQIHIETGRNMWFL